MAIRNAGFLLNGRSVHLMKSAKTYLRFTILLILNKGVEWQPNQNSS